MITGTNAWGPRASGDFKPDDVQRQGEISLARGKEVNYDSTGRLVNTVFKGDAAE